MFWHWHSDHKGLRALKQGRAWLHFGKDGNRSIGFEWNFRWSKHFAAEVTCGREEQDLTLALCGGFFGFYLTFSLLPYGAMQRGWGRTTGICLSGEHLTLRWACDDSSVSYHTDAKGKRRSRPEHGWYRSWFLKDALLGRAAYASRDVGISEATITMPEGAYACTVRMHEDTWSRPRWPWPLRILRATVDAPGGIPHPGKGENAWDCDEDATYSITCPASTPAEAVERLRQSVLRSRLRYGGEGWRPGALAA